MNKFRRKQRMLAAFMLMLSSFILTSFVCKEELSKATIHETRGVWVTRWDYTTKINSTDPDSQKAEIHRLFKIAENSNLNSVFFQVRGAFDAYYNSNYEPWAKTLTDTLGVYPGWDPLEFAIRESKVMGLQLHAWVNVFSLWKGKTPPGSSYPQHAYHSNPEWIAVDSKGLPMKLNDHYVYANPGNPEVRKHVLNVVLDIVRNYDIDGIHFDYIRYPENSNNFGYSKDSISISQFNSREGNPDSLEWEDWQRRNVHLFVKSVKDSVSVVKPNLALSAAVLGKYKLPGWSGYDVVYQDAVPWIEEGWLDFIVPMTYTNRKHETASFTKLIHNWNKRTGKPNSILAGIAAYRAEGKNGWGWKEIAYQINDVRKEQLGGMVFFNAGALEADWNIVQKSFFKNSALPQPVIRQTDSGDVTSVQTEYSFLNLK
ncbi:MAG: family 10 glycosylhydrolase [Candidatus Marinimicrobia bacterium]|nr:family 10 glycosylhydrolase [Candidatus Neomarinimicrobiota bacterium]